MPTIKGHTIMTEVNRRRDDLLRELSEKIASHQVVDVIFFPEFNHAPIVRLDGSGMNMEQVIKLETSAKEIMVRQPEFAGAITPKAMEELSRAGYAEKVSHLPTDEQDTEFSKIIQGFLKQYEIDVENLRIWEVETHGQDVVIRLISGELSKSGNVVDIEGVRIEFLTDYQSKELEALLGFFDHVKSNKKPFLQTLKKFIENTIDV